MKSLFKFFKTENNHHVVSFYFTVYIQPLNDCFARLNQRVFEFICSFHERRKTWENLNFNVRILINAFNLFTLHVCVHFVFLFSLKFFKRILISAFVIIA
jgi:hypothetical protein